MLVRSMGDAGAQIDQAALSAVAKLPFGIMIGGRTLVDTIPKTVAPTISPTSMPATTVPAGPWNTELTRRFTAAGVTTDEGARAWLIQQIGIDPGDNGVSEAQAQSYVQALDARDKRRREFRTVLIAGGVGLGAVLLLR